MSIIAVDCDEVLIESIRSLSKYAKEKYDHSWLYEDFRDYFISNNDHIDMSAEESIVLFDEYFTSLHAEDAKPVAGAKEILEKWKKEGHTLIVVTARNDLARPLTLKQLDKHYPGIFDDIVFVHFYTDKHIPKSEVCRKLGVHYLIEDSLENAMDVAEVGIPVFVLEKPRNSRRDETHENIYKIQNWKDIILHESL